MKKFFVIALSIVLALGILGIGNITISAQQIPGNASPLSHVGGMFYASAYSTWHSTIISGNTTTGSGTSITVTPPTAMLDGTPIAVQIAWNSVLLNAPLIQDGNAETATAMTAISYSTCPAGNLGIGGTPICATLTGTFANTHGQSAIVTDGTFGLSSALAAAYAAGGGQVVVDAAWTALGGTSAMINALVVGYPTVTILDVRSGAPRNWLPTPTGLALATPTTLTAQAACDSSHQFCSDANVAGSASWGGSLYGCVAYVDIMGNEGPCSAASTVFTSVASKAIDVAAPAASSGAVGYVVYLSLSGGTYALAYQIPSTSTNCTLTTLETITPACAVANTTYGQAASTYGADALFTKGGSQITTYPVNTAMDYPILATTAATLAAQHPMTNSSVSYAFVPSSRVGACQISSANMVQVSAAGGINGSSATTVPNPMVSWTVPSGCFNYIGAEVRVSGKFTYTDGGDSSTHVIVAWDSNVTNTASVPTPICDMLDTATGTGAAYNGNWTCTFRVLTTGTAATVMANGYSAQALAAGATTLVRNTTDKAVAASAAIDLATNGRITVWFEGIGATNNPGAQALEATLEVLN